FQAEDGIRDRNVTGVQTCALPIYGGVSTTAFREVVLALHRDWDRLPDDAGDAPDPGAVDLPPAPDLSEVIAHVGGIVAWRDQCRDETDKLYATLGEHEAWLEQLTASLEDPGATPTWAELLGAPRTAGRGGRGDAWGGKETVETIK